MIIDTRLFSLPCLPPSSFVTASSSLVSLFGQFRFLAITGEVCLPDVRFRGETSLTHYVMKFFLLRNFLWKNVLQLENSGCFFSEHACWVTTACMATYVVQMIRVSRDGGGQTRVHSQTELVDAGSNSPEVKLPQAATSIFCRGGRTTRMDLECLRHEIESSSLTGSVSRRLKVTIGLTRGVRPPSETSWFGRHLSVWPQIGQETLRHPCSRSWRHGFCARLSRTGS